MNYGLGQLGQGIAGFPRSQMNMYEWVGSTGLRGAGQFGGWNAGIVNTAIIGPLKNSLDHGFYDIGYSGVAPGTLRGGINFGLRLNSTGLHFYYGVGSGYGMGISATYNYGSFSSGIKTGITLRGGTGFVGGRAYFGLSQQGVGGYGGAGFGVGFGISTTGSQTIQLIDFAKIFSKES